MEAYKRWVRENKDYIQSLESMANGLTWLLPERFSTSEIGPEAVTAFFGIITALNQHIIETSPPPKQATTEKPHSFPYSLCISALKELETLVEVAAHDYFGEEKKWNFIALMEAAKVIVRLALFRNSGYKMLLHGGETLNEGDQMKDSTLHNKPGSNLRNLEGRAMYALNSFGGNAMKTFSEPEWLRRVHPQHAMIEPPTFERLTFSTILAEKGFRGALYISGEVLFIARPLIYVAFIRKYGLRSWIPWVVSLCVDFLGMGILSQATTRVDGEKEKILLSSAEQHEIKRRRLLWAFYLMRDPFFIKHIRQRLERTEKILEPVPAVGLLTGKLVELIIGAQTRCTYTSGS